MEYKETDLVLIRLESEPYLDVIQRKYNIWVRVLFKDDTISHGEIERAPSFCQGGNYGNNKGDAISFENEKVLSVFNVDDGKSWCYTDDVTRCECKGLCRNK